MLNTGSDPRSVWQTQISLTLYVSCRMVTSSSIEEPATKGSRRERSLVSSCKITMSGANEATTGRSYCSVLATVLPPTPCHLNAATLFNNNWWLRLGFAATKLSKRRMNEWMPQNKNERETHSNVIQNNSATCLKNVFAKRYTRCDGESKREYLRMWPIFYADGHMTLFNMIGCYATWQTTIGSTNMCLE